MTETWREIPGTEGVYEASTLGRIRSKDRVITRRGRWGIQTDTKYGCVLKSWPDAGGYPVVYICTEGKRVATNVHRLIAVTFHGTADGRHVNHINGDKADNRPENLEWCTRSENMTHARDTGLWTKCVRVVGIDREGNERRFPSIHSAARHVKGRHSNIQAALKKDTATAYGFRWKLAA